MIEITHTNGKIVIATDDRNDFGPCKTEQYLTIYTARKLRDELSAAIKIAEKWK